MQFVLPLADRYDWFQQGALPSVREPPSLPGLEESWSELDLQSLWFAGAFGRDFLTTDGKVVRIADFGIWNSGVGPDYTGCAVEIAGQIVRGDIELDPDVRDWERHAHGGNPDYDHVVLHLFLGMPKDTRCFTRTSNHRDVPQVLLSYDMLADGAQPKRGLAPAQLGRCAGPLTQLPDHQLQAILESAAQYRLRRKSQWLHRWVAAHGREQAVFQALAQTLGYKNNQQPFLILSQRLPLKRLNHVAAIDREALLFGVSGFMDVLNYEESGPDTRDYLRNLWHGWWRMRDGCQRWLNEQQRLRWKLAGTRPGNHPQRRVGALAAILAQWHRIAAPLIDSTRWSQAGWREALLSLSHEYWDNHYTLQADAARKPLALIGESRVQEMLANVAYPLLVPERTRLWAEYLELPAMLDNQKLRRASMRLFGDSPRGEQFQKKLHQQQGLLQLYEDFCLEDDSACTNCRFPERLQEWR